MATNSSETLTNWTVNYPVKLADGQALHPVGRIIRVYASYTGSANIKRAKLRVLVDGTSINTGSEIIIEPILGTTNTFQVDLSDLLVNYLNVPRPDLTASHAWLEDDKSVKEIKISIAEVTLNGSTGQLDTASYKTTANAFGVCAGTYDDTEADTFSFADTSTRGFKFEPYISNRPLRQRFRLNDHAYAPAYYESSKGNLRLAYTIYTGSTVTASGNIDLTPTGNAGLAGYGPADINDAVAGVITSATTHYTVAFSYTLDTTYDTVTVILDNTCNDSHTMLSFTTKLGFLDNYLFRGDKIRNTDVKRTDIKIPEDIDSFANDRSENRYRVNNIRKTVSYSISTGLITEAEAKYLEQVLESDYAYIIEGTEYIPVQILGAKKIVEDKVKGIVSMSVDYVQDVTDRQGLGAPALI